MCKVENEDVVGVAPKGDAPTTSEWPTILLPTNAHLILEVWRYSMYLGRFIATSICYVFPIVTHYDIHYHYVFLSVSGYIGLCSSGTVTNQRNGELRYRFDDVDERTQECQCNITANDEDVFVHFVTTLQTDNYDNCQPYIGYKNFQTSFLLYSCPSSAASTVDIEVKQGHDLGISVLNGDHLAANFNITFKGMYFILHVSSMGHTLKTESCHDTSFVTTCGTVSFRCHPRRQSWYRDNSRFLVYKLIASVKINYQ